MCSTKCAAIILKTFLFYNFPTQRSKLNIEFYFGIDYDISYKWDITKIVQYEK